jgi:hypothetical protein
MSDILLTSPILRDPSEAGPGGAEDGGNAFEFGFDPSLDPELAMVRGILVLPRFYHCLCYEVFSFLHY